MALLISIGFNFLHQRTIADEKIYTGFIGNVPFPTFKKMGVKYIIRSLDNFRHDLPTGQPIPIPQCI